MISRIIEVSVRVISLSRITKTESNNCFITHWREKLKSCFCFFTGKQHKARKLDMITLRIMHRGHIWQDYPWPWVSLTWLLYNLQLWRHGLWFRKFTVRFRPIRKEIASSMYNKSHSRSVSQSVRPLYFFIRMMFRLDQLTCQKVNVQSQEPITRERATLILSLCHDIFTDRSIFRLLFPRNCSAPDCTSKVEQWWPRVHM